jgi:hypothetical protein
MNEFESLKRIFNEFFEPIYQRLFSQTFFPLKGEREIFEFLSSAVLNFFLRH